MPNGGTRSVRVMEMNRKGFMLVVMGYTGKRHDNVLRDIAALLLKIQDQAMSFRPSTP